MGIGLKLGICLLIVLVFAFLMTWLVVYISNRTMYCLVKASIDSINSYYHETYGRDATRKEIIENGIYPREYYEKYV